MAKIAQVTYGTSGEGKLYTYVVNDSVKPKQIINPSVKHHKSGKIFATTALVQEAASSRSARGRELKEDAQVEIDESNEERGTDKELVKAVAPSDIGLTRATQTRGAGGRFQGSYSATGGVKITQNADGTYSGTNPQDFTRNPYINAQRGANLQYRTQTQGGVVAETEIQQKAQETFETYSAKFMPTRR